MVDREQVRALATEYHERGDATGWFEAAYQQAEAGSLTLPWADLRPNPNLTSYWSAHPMDTAGKRALVVGCGLGDDAEQLSRWGFDTVGFDIAPTAIEACRRRFPESPVQYVAADLLAPPLDWARAFDFVFEAYTMQALPIQLRSNAIAQLANFVSAGGCILVVARARDDDEPALEMPWPLSPRELSGFEQAGLARVSFEDYSDQDPDPPVRRYRALYRRES